MQSGQRQGKNRPAWNASSTLLRGPRFVERSVTVAAILGAIGIAFIVAGVAWGGAAGTVTASLGSMFVTVALLSVLYDAYLKDVLLSEIYDAMEIEQNVRTIDLKSILRKDQLDLASQLADVRTLTAIPLDPDTWLRNDWQQVVDYAAQEKVKVTVYLPDHDSPHIDVLAQRLDLDRDDLARQIERLPDQLARSWDERVIGESSTLSIVLYSGVAAVGILVTDHTTILEVPPALTHAATDRRTLAVVLGRKGSSALITDFVDAQLKEGRIPDFSQSVMRPLREAVSPDAPHTPL